MTDEHTRGEAETDALIDAQRIAQDEPPWDELRPLDAACLGVFAGIAVCIVVLILRV